MSTSGSVDDTAVPSSTRSADAPAGAGAPPEQAAAGRRGLVPTVLLALVTAVAVLPAITAIPYYLAHGGRYHPWSDHALIELQVRLVGHHPISTGPFSREGWHHPGPAMYYLIAGPYHLLGESSAALPVTALLVNAACVVLAAWLLRRAVGTPGAVAGVVALAFYLRVAPAGFWRDPWNPYIAVLPLLVTILACLLALGGSYRFLPLAVATGSFSAECHVGFVLPVAAVLGATALVLLGRPLVRRRAEGGPAARLGDVGRGVRRRIGVLAACLAVFVVMWALPVGQQIFGKQGNLTLIWDYLRSHHSTTSLADAARVVLSQVGAVPGYVAGRTPHQDYVTFPPVLPVWTGLVGLVAFAVAGLAAARMRHAALLRLAGLSALVTVTAFVAVSRVIGPVFAYLVEWTAVAGVLVWTTVAATLVTAVGRALAARRSPHPIAPGLVDQQSDSADETRGHSPRVAAGSGVQAGLAGLVGLAAVAITATLAAFTVHDTARATTPGTTSIGTPGDSADIAPLTQAVLTWLGPAHRHDPVRVEIAPTGGPNLVDPTLLLTPGLNLDLRKHGVHAVADPAMENAYGPYLDGGYDQAPWRIVVSYGDQSRIPPGAGKVLGRSGGFLVYGSVNPYAQH